MSRGIAYAVAFLAALASSFLLTWYIQRKSTQLGFVSIPSGADHHVHSEPVPRLGGVAVYLSTVVLLLVCALLQPLAFKHDEISFVVMLKILVPATFVFLVGLYDDMRSLSPWFKLACEFIAAVTVYQSGFSIVSINLGPYTAIPLSGFVSFVLSIGWILAVTNALNLIDGLDGLAAGSAVFSTVVLFMVALRYEKDFMGLVAAVVAGAAVGFLRFNFNPATIFLGDSGSLFIGFLLSVVAMTTSVKAPTMIVVAIPLACFGLPIVDTVFAVFRRTRSGKHILIADRDHIHHRLLKRGLTHRQAVIVLYCISALFALIGLVMLHRGAGTAAVLLILGAAFWIVVRMLGFRGFSKLAGATRQRESTAAKNENEPTLFSQMILSANRASKTHNESLVPPITSVTVKDQPDVHR